MRSNQKSQFLKRLRLHEALESRCLLASVTADSPWQNPLDASDLDCDGQVTASDALMAINAINSQGAGDLHAKFAPSMLAGHVKGAAAGFLDASGDGSLTALDPLVVINAINSGLHHLGWLSDGNTTDNQPEIVGSTAEKIDISSGFAKVRSAINADGDVDVFQVAPDKAELNISLISGANGVLHVSVVTINTDSSGQPIIDPTTGNPEITEVGSASTQTDSHQPAKVNIDVTAGTTYYVVVSGDAHATGAYALALLNYNLGDFQPVTDSPLGTDSHGNAIATASVLTLNHGHAEVTSNIDPVATGTDADKDLFQITAVNGKLAVAASAEFPLTISILDSTGAVKGTITSDRAALILDASAGTYYVSVAAASATDTGAYHLTVANAAIPSLPDLGHHLPQIPTAADIFAKLDANGKDGVSLTEWESGLPLGLGHNKIADALFTKLDSNNDGSLSVDEIMAGLGKLHLPGLIGDHGHDDHMLLPPVVTNH